MDDVYVKAEETVAGKPSDVAARLLEATHREDLNHHEEAKNFLTEQVPDYCKRVAALANRPEAADLMAWIREQAKDDDNHLFRILTTQMA